MTTIAKARGRLNVKPVWLVEIALKNSGGTLYFSDKNIVVGSQRYEDYLESLSSMSEQLGRKDSHTINTNLRLTFKNDVYQSYDNLILIGDTYPFEGAGVTIKECYLEDDDDPSDVETRFVGVLDAPRSIDVTNFICDISSVIYHKDRTWQQEFITTDEFPNAHEDLGAIIPIIYGKNILVPALRVDWGARTTLAETIAADLVSDWHQDHFQYPTSDGANNDILVTPASPGTIYDKIDDPEASPDDDATKISAATNDVVGAWKSASVSNTLGGSPFIDTLLVYARVKTANSSTSVNYVEVGVAVDGVEYYLDDQGVGMEKWASTSWMRGSKFWRLNPATGLPWTVAEANAAQICVRAWKLNGSFSAEVTQMYKELQYENNPIKISDGSRFPNDGVQVLFDNEQIRIATGPRGNYITRYTRAFGSTTATAHRAGCEIWEVQANYDSLVAGHELVNIGDIFAEIEGKLLRVLSGVAGLFTGGKHLLRATKQISVEVIQDDLTVLDNIGFTSADSSKTLIPNDSGDPVGDNMDNPLNAIDGNSDTFAGGNGGGPAHPSTWQNTVDFPSTDFGTTTRQFAYITYATAGGGSGTANVGRSLGDQTAWGTLPPTTTKQTVRLELDDAGDWDDPVFILFTTASGGDWIAIYEVEKVVEYVPILTKTGAASRGGSGLIATYKVDRFHAVVDGYEDDTSGDDYGGSVVERPDHLIEHFLVEVLGFTSTDIDAASFVAAGSSYNTEGYVFGFRLDRKIRPSRWLQRMAFECRSVLRFVSGKWYLDYLPDSAPSADKIIKKEEIALRYGKFVFHKTNIDGLANDITARYAYIYSHLFYDTWWGGTTAATDATSKSKYGTYEKAFDFLCIRDAAMAQDVLNHILLQRKNPLLKIEFPVFYEHFDLKIGDTVQITNTLWTGKKFFLEVISRMSKGVAMLKGLEWY